MFQGIELRFGFRDKGPVTQRCVRSSRQRSVKIGTLSLHSSLRKLGFCISIYDVIMICFRLSNSDLVGGSKVLLPQFCVRGLRATFYEHLGMIHACVVKKTQFLYFHYNTTSLKVSGYPTSIRLMVSMSTSVTWYQE